MTDLVWTVTPREASATMRVESFVSWCLTLLGTGLTFALVMR